jgi:hypothetical protein
MALAPGPIVMKLFTAVIYDCERCFTRVVSGYIRLGRKGLQWQQPSLLGTYVNYHCKKFYNIEPWIACYLLCHQITSCKPVILTEVEPLRVIS